MEDFMYHYKVSKVISIYDGDTMTVDLDLGFNITMGKRSLRLYGINTPEVRGESREEGKRVRDYVRNLVHGANEVYIKSHYDKSGKYGRILATVILVNEDEELILNEHLLDEGMAIPYMK